ncbi:MAG: hypothetical protein Kow0099_19050 [Candidatus Abyssubacteria bacterium]
MVKVAPTFTMYLLVAAIVLLSTPVRADMRIEAEYLYDLRSSALDSQFQRQSGILCDPERNETYVVDTGNHCIRIFGKEGMEIFKFGHNGELGIPLDVAVNGLGDMYVLGSGSGGRQIDVFDFRGKFLRSFELKGLPEGETCEPHDIAVDSHNNIYLSDPKRGCVFSFDADGQFRFRILPEMSDKERKEAAFGNLMIDSGDRLYLPMSTLGTVYVFDSEGQTVRNFGIQGGGPGKLAFPVDVAVDKHGHCFVLDKLRHCVAVYDRDGNYVTEFGGMGQGPGWFFYPSDLEIDRYGRLYVSQLLGNKVQVLKVKEALK